MTRELKLVSWNGEERSESGIKDGTGNELRLKKYTLHCMGSLAERTGETDEEGQD